MSASVSRRLSGPVGTEAEQVAIGIDNSHLDGPGLLRLRLEDVDSATRNEGAEQVALWLGHRDLRMVHRVYDHLLAYDGSITQSRFEAGNEDTDGKVIRFPAS